MFNRAENFNTRVSDDAEQLSIFEKARRWRLQKSILHHHFKTHLRYEGGPMRTFWRRNMKFQTFLHIYAAKNRKSGEHNWPNVDLKISSRCSKIKFCPKWSNGAGFWLVTLFLPQNLQKKISSSQLPWVWRYCSRAGRRHRRRHSVLRMIKFTIPSSLTEHCCLE